jgi:hypothetical protein
MSANPQAEMAKLLQALETVDVSSDDRLNSALRQLARLHATTKPEAERFLTADQSANPLVERIATAMKLSVKAR